MKLLSLKGALQRGKWRRRRRNGKASMKIFLTKLPAWQMAIFVFTKLQGQPCDMVVVVYNNLVLFGWLHTQRKYTGIEGEWEKWCTKWLSDEGFIPDSPAIVVFYQAICGWECFLLSALISSCLALWLVAVVNRKKESIMLYVVCVCR